MPSKEVYTEIEGQRLKITNLHKLIYPSKGYTKAEVISYYLEIAPTFLKYISDRPLTLIRYPDGVESKKFYTKNKPSWTKDWIPTTHLPWDEENEYLLATKSPHVVWLANLAALEIHTMNSRTKNINNPDHFIIDLDPPENADFESVKKLAFQLKELLESKGYFPFAKLSGGKGIHITTAIHPKWDYETMITSVKNLMKEFIQTHPETTLFVHKDKRKNKTLLDIYRNHPGNTTIAPYSLRGKVGAPVSMPLPWELIEKATSAQMYDLKSAIDYLKENGDAWNDLFLKASNLHDSVIQDKGETKLGVYEEKRDFAKTKEPSAKKDGDENDVNDKFVIQMHDATNLHFDLRLGVDGVLKSWAIPKGLPIEEGIKRLAIQTEDHPAKYIDFEGTIPKDEYGGGEMWVFETGDIEWLKKSKDSLKFTLKGKQLKASYTMYKLKDKDEWIIERKESANLAVYKTGMKPMLSDVAKEIPSNSKDYLFEIKWDGIRVIIYKRKNELKILSRSGRDITKQFPEFADGKFLYVQNAIIDAELVCIDAEGRPVFSDIISRMHSMGEHKILSLSKTKKAYIYTFDCLYINGKKMISMPYIKRHDWLKAILKTSDKVRISETFENGQEIYEAAKMMNLEGIMAKQKNGKYFTGTRSDAWKKIKFRNTITLNIIGYTEGKGDRKNIFGALHLAERQEKNWKYYGKVGTGFDMAKMKELWVLLQSVEEAGKPISENIEEENRTKWINPDYLCEVTYASLSSNETLREPVFIRMWLEF